MAAWKDWLARVPPKNSNRRTWMLTMLVTGLGLISTVAGLNGTAVLTEPRVATVAQRDSAVLA